MSQFALPLDFTWRDAELSFILGEANRAAVAQLSSWSDWPEGAVVLVGAEASGKSHLAKLMSNRLGDSLKTWDLGNGDIADEVELFHALNRAREGRELILILARTPPGRWPLELPDLRSRVRALPLLFLEAPDDDLLAELLAERLSRRGLAVPPNVIEYAVKRMPRTYAAVEDVATRADAAALAGGRKLTVPLMTAIFADESDQ